MSELNWNQSEKYLKYFVAHTDREKKNAFESLIEIHKKMKNPLQFGFKRITIDCQIHFLLYFERSILREFAGL